MTQARYFDPILSDAKAVPIRPANSAENRRKRLARWARKSLTIGAVSWFVTAVIGQMLFVTYIIGFYGLSALGGNPEAWNQVLPHGWEAGNVFGNTIVSLHLIFTVLIIVGGVLQLTPIVRKRWPAFHRLNGRFYMFSAVLMSIGGLIMLWTRNAVGDLSQHIALSLNALLILLCAGMALRYALQRRLDVHRRWAIRLFLAVSGVWFFRVGLMFWLVANQGPVGFDPVSFTGPFLSFIAFAQYLLPLAIAELYFRAQRSSNIMRQLMTTSVLVVSTLVTGAGIAAAGLLMWLPLVSS